MRVRLFIMIILGGLLILISWQNIQEVTLKFVVWEPTLPLILLIYLTFFGGFLFGLFYGRINLALKKFKEKRRERRQEKQQKMSSEKNGSE